MAVMGGRWIGVKRSGKWANAIGKYRLSVRDGVRTEGPMRLRSGQQNGERGSVRVRNGEDVRTGVLLSC